MAMEVLQNLGFVHVYSYDKENFTVDEVFKFYRPLMVPLSSLGKIFLFREIFFLFLLPEAWAMEWFMFSRDLINLTFGNM